VCTLDRIDDLFLIVCHENLLRNSIYLALEDFLVMLTISCRDTAGFLTESLGLKPSLLSIKVIVQVINFCGTVLEIFLRLFSGLWLLITLM